jgi:hypothetical protein
MHGGNRGDATHNTWADRVHGISSLTLRDSNSCGSDCRETEERHDLNDTEHRG